MLLAMIWVATVRVPRTLDSRSGNYVLSLAVRRGRSVPDFCIEVEIADSIWCGRQSLETARRRRAMDDEDEAFIWEEGDGWRRAVM